MEFCGASGVGFEASGRMYEWNTGRAGNGRAMAVVVMKFGGTSVANVERIQNVARHVKREVDAGNKVAVVVSAMSGVTNQLVALVKDASGQHLYDEREYDAVVATGEQVTAGLLAIALQTLGLKARSWTGWQVPIETSTAHGSARILEIPGDKIRARLDAGEVAVVTGFQGVEPGSNRVATLGRGGSDTSAVAMAVALKADVCDIYTDVDGVYTTDPRIVPKARRLPKISYEEMLEMASLGSKVLQTRSVELGMVYKMRTRVLSSFVAPDAMKAFSIANLEDIGTIVCDEDEIDLTDKVCVSPARRMDVEQCSGHRSERPKPSCSQSGQGRDEQENCER